MNGQSKQDQINFISGRQVKDKNGWSANNAKDAKIKAKEIVSAGERK
jgi:hypothetical protein